jgi:hypothetical protein
MKYIKNILFLFILFLPAVLFAQVTVNAEIDSVQIMIGNQANLKLSVTQPKETFVQFPVFSDTIANGVEIVKQHEPDTLQINNERIEIIKNYTVAVFDSGVYFIQPFKFIVQNDTLTTSSLTMKAFTLPVDTVNIDFRDIKPNLLPPLTWKDIARIAMWCLLVVVLLAVIAYIVYRLVNHKSILPESKKKELPPHVTALESLNKLKDEKLWQQGRDKEFHTELTDVVRTYIEKRFNVNAMEMTSDEILDYLSKNEETKSVLEQLKQILKAADLVKFAKMKLLPNENESSLSNSYLFVEETKEEEKEEEEKE